MNLLQDTQFGRLTKAVEHEVSDLIERLVMKAEDATDAEAKVRIQIHIYVLKCFSGKSF